jgi:hypothetical protein
LEREVDVLWRSAGAQAAVTAGPREVMNDEDEQMHLMSVSWQPVAPSAAMAGCNYLVEAHVSKVTH